MEQPNKNIKLVSKKNTRVILPNILTLIGVCIGLSSIKFAFDGKFELSIIAVIIAGIIDGLDGRIARLIKGTSKVGKELDSLTDVISFGVAPAFIMYFWKLNELGRIGWLICLIYVVCVALRLARFNVNFSSKANLIELKPIHTPTSVNIFGKITLVFLLLTSLKFLFCCSIYYFFAIKVSPAIVF